MTAMSYRMAFSHVRLHCEWSELVRGERQVDSFNCDSKFDIINQARSNYPDWQMERGWMGHGEGEGDGCTMPSKCITHVCLHTHLKEVLQKCIKLWFVCFIYLCESSVIVPQIHALSNVTLLVSEMEYSLFFIFLHSCTGFPMQYF